MKYKTIEELFVYIQGRIRTALWEFYIKNKAGMLTAQGSQHNHQAWQGGYIDHVVETMNIARVLYDTMYTMRPLEFSLSDTMIVLFLHDIEKMFPERITVKAFELGIIRSAAKSIVRQDILEEENLVTWLTSAQYLAIKNIEVERDYSNTQRGMNPLAAFCHICDSTSARIWFDRPLPVHEKWGWRTSAYEENQEWAV